MTLAFCFNFIYLIIQSKLSLTHNSVVSVMVFLSGHKDACGRKLNSRHCYWQPHDSHEKVSDSRIHQVQRQAEAPRTTARTDIIALPHPTQVIIRNVSPMSRKMKHREFVSLREEIRWMVLTKWFLEKLQHTKYPWDSWRILFPTCYDHTFILSLWALNW